MSTVSVICPLTILLIRTKKPPKHAGHGGFLYTPRVQKRVEGLEQVAQFFAVVFAHDV